MSRPPLASKSTWRPLVATASAGEETFEDVTSFPAVNQDIAVVIPPRSRPPATEAVLAGGGELLRAAEVFDLYEGEQLGEGRKSLALRLEFRAADRTLTDEEVVAQRAAIEAELARSGVAPWLTSTPQPLDGDPAARVLVAGASGFTGALAAQIVWRHPKLELVAVTSRSDAGTRLDRLYPRYRVPLELTELDLDEIEGVDAAIVAYPHGASAPAVPRCAASASLVVDLSADFRLRDLPTYERWYGEHGAPELLEGAVYGLTELYREQLREAELVATPGCYPTASVLALAPLAERGLLADVVIDAKQGVSGAGRGGGDAMHYVSMDENAFAYKTEGHRHRPEIEQELAALGSPAPVTFVPHLLPLDQGELTSCYAQTSEPISKDEVQTLYRERYADEPFVHVVDGPPGLRDVRDTNECHVYVTVEERGRVLAFSAIDNLWKGASGQGVQNLNLMLGLDETHGADVSGFFKSRWVEPTGRGRGARPRSARAWLPRRRCPLRPQGRRQDRHRPARLRRPAGLLGDPAHPQRLRGGAGAGLPQALRARRDPRRGGQRRQRQRRDR